MPPSRGRPSTASNNATGPAAVPLPPHQPPAHELNEQGRKALHLLADDARRLNGLKMRLHNATTNITQSAADINDRLTERVKSTEQRSARLAAFGSSQLSSENEEHLEEMRRATDEMTNKLEASARQLVDSGDEVNRFGNALKALDENIQGDTPRRNKPQSQSTLGASQFRPTHPDEVNSRADEMEEEDPDSQNRDQPRSALTMLKDSISHQRDSYDSLSMTDRYAFHNDYTNFRKIVHDAQHPGERAPPLPHPSTWFSDTNSAHGMSEHMTRGSQAVEEDDDIAIETERISVKCPITLTEMKDPVSSTKCPHNYERQGFLDMLASSALRVGADGRRNPGTQAMRCPVPGCDVVRVCSRPGLSHFPCQCPDLLLMLFQMLTREDIRADPVLVRKIKRIQAALNARNEDEDDEPRSRSRHGNNAQRQGHSVITSSPAPTASNRFKAERASQALTRSVSMIPGTQIDSFVNDDEESQLL